MTAAVASNVEAVVRRGVRRRRVRRAITFVMLVLFSTLIAGYVYVTDSDRVRRFAEKTLADEIGGHVTIGAARLSIFEGLHLDDVRVRAGRGSATPIFEARSLHISYDPRAIVTGHIAADRVVALQPRVHLIEDLDTQTWNFQALEQPHSMSGASRGRASAPPPLPEVLIRNARFDYAQVQKGRTTDVGSLLLEGQFTPDAAGQFHFRVQSHGGSDGVFPEAEGTLRPDLSAVHLAVRDVAFVDEIKTILPAEVRRFWEAHELSGRLDEMRLDVFRKPDGRSGYRVQTDLAGVSLSVPPLTWMGRSDATRVQRWHDAYARLSRPDMGGSVMAARIVGAMAPAALKLSGVDAQFVFSDEGIAINRLTARVDQNTINVSGHIDGYSGNAAIDLNVQSAGRLVLADAPAFIPAMPWPVQEIYYRFRPVGTCDLSLQINRPTGAEHPQLRGQLKVHDARFTFEKLPYPVEGAEGVFRFGNDPETGRELLEIAGVTGHGRRGGPNEKATLRVRGTITPLDETAGADIQVRGDDVDGDRALIDCLPPVTRHAVLNFDAAKTGTLPAFRGNFSCDVHRAVGLGQPWLIKTKLDLKDGTGLFVGFPYPLHGVTGGLTIYDDHLDLDHIHVPAGQGVADLRGTIGWQHHDAKTGEPLIQPDLNVKADGIVIDDDLINALPAARRGMIARLGVGGRLDVTGHITAAAIDSEEPAIDLALKLTDGRLRPPGVPLNVADLRASVRVKGDRVDVTHFDGTVAGAAVTGAASADASTAEPRVSVEADVAALDAAAAPLDALPADAAKAVRSLHAAGHVDLHLRYEPDGYTVTLRPRDLVLTPDLFPLRFDHFDGDVAVKPDGVHLSHVTARHQNAQVFIDGRIDPVSGDAAVSLAGRDLTVDAAFIKALPTVLQGVATSLSLSGPVAIDCPELNVRQSAAGQPDRTQFRATLWLQKAALQVAAELKNVVGQVSLEGAVEGGALRQLAGQLTIDDMTFAGRPVSRLNATLRKSADRDVLQLTGIDARVAGGQVAGQIDTVLDRRDPRFGLNLLVRNAKVRELTGDLTGPTDATLNASLAMEGRWDDAASRRGRGDVQVQGKAMYKVPVVFGLMQVANLALPNDAPIRQAGLRYTITGNQIHMDQIDLRSDQSVMQGDGLLDFDKKTVQLNLSLANSAADAMPLFGDLIKTARQDLMRMRIRGSLTGPGDGGQAFNIFNGSVDEVKTGK